MLGCNRVFGRHTAENIMVWYDEVTTDFGISEKVQHIVTANIKKAFLTLPGYEEDDKSDSEDDEEEEDHEAVSVSSEELLFEPHACFAHTLQLVIKDGLKKAGQLNTVIKKCSKIVSFTRRSTVAADTLEGEKRLQADNVTRWNSQLKMIRSVLSIPASKLSEVEGIPTLTAHDRNLLQDIKRSLLLLKKPLILFRYNVCHQLDMFYLVLED